MTATRDRRRVLVVDDDPDIARLVEIWLRDVADVAVAHGAVAAVALGNEQPPDVVLTDFNMPGETGVWLLEHAATQWPFARRVLFSGGDPSSFADARRTGVVQLFIQKPLQRVALIEALGLTRPAVDLAPEKDSEVRLAATLDKSPDELMAELSLAMQSDERVVVLLRGDPVAGRPVRAIEGVPIEFRPAVDGRARVVLQVEDDAQQVVLIERIARVRRNRTAAAR